jgi:hypothetical protein
MYMKTADKYVKGKEIAWIEQIEVKKKTQMSLGDDHHNFPLG